MLCVPEVTSLQACVFPHHTPSAPDPQPSHLSPLQQAQQIPNLALPDASPVWASQAQSQLPGLLCPALSRVSPAALLPPQFSSGNLTCTQGRESWSSTKLLHVQALQGSQGNQPYLPQYPSSGLSLAARHWGAVSQSVLETESKQSLNR